MTSRERVIRAIEFTNPDRVPLFHGILPAAWYAYGERLRKIVEKHPRDLYEHNATSPKWYPWDSFLNRMSWNIEDDFAEVVPRGFEFGTEEIGNFSDEWGCIWHKVEPGITGQVLRHPLEEWGKIKSYRFPDPLAYWRFDIPSVEETIKKAKAKGKYITAYAGHFFELMQELRGYENLLTDIVQYPDRVIYLAEKITDYIMKTIEVWKKFEVDCITFMDDWGTQEQLMIRPEVWRKLFKPYYKKIFEVVHSINRHVLFHSDGHIMDIVPDLMEIGVDILNPQFSSMNLVQLSEITRGKMCILADIDRQYILPRGTPEEVKKYVKYVFDLFARREGGFIFRGWIEGKDTLLNNVEVMYRAYGEYKTPNTTIKLEKKNEHSRGDT